MEKPSTESVPTRKPKIIIKFPTKNHHHHHHHSPISDLKKPKKLIAKKSHPKIIITFGNNINPPAPTHHSPPSTIKPKIIIKLGKKPLDLNEEEDSFENSHGSSWRRGPLLGAGGFGSVFLAQYYTSNSPNYTEIAVKSSLIEDSCSLRLEKKVLEDLAPCSSVVQCYGEEVTKSSGKSGRQIYNILLEYCCGGSLSDLIARFKGSRGLVELSARLLTRDIVRGIAHIHGKGYIHCDIKPDNILLSKNCGCLVAKIADFGLALRMSSTNNMEDEYEVRGTKLYMAPESTIDWPVDIWALGCVVVEMLTATTAWTSRRFDPRHLLTHSYHKLPRKLRSLSPMAIDFLSTCFIHTPHQRSSATSLLDHPFINFH